MTSQDMPFMNKNRVQAFIMQLRQAAVPPSLMIITAAGGLAFCLTIILKVVGVSFYSILFWVWISALALIVGWIIKSCIRLNRSINKYRAELMEQLEEKNDKLCALVKKLNSSLVALEKIPPEQWHLITKKGTKILSFTKRLVVTLGERLDNVHQLIEAGDVESLTQASKLFENTLEFRTTSFDVVLDEHTISRLESKDWEPTIELLCRELAAELKIFKRAA